MQLEVLLRTVEWRFTIYSELIIYTATGVLSPGEKCTHVDISYINSYIYIYKSVYVFYLYIICYEVEVCVCVGAVVSVRILKKERHLKASKYT